MVRDGTVSGVWVGKLDAAEESQVLDKLWSGLGLSAERLAFRRHRT